MITLNRSALSGVIAALAFAAGVTVPVAQADDTEVFFTPVGDAAAPNILFILDSSESMSTLLPPTPGSGTDDPKPDWDPSEDWLGNSDITATGCQANRLYWLQTPVSPDEFPKDCAGLNYIEVNLADPNDASNKFVCKAALDTLFFPGNPGYVLQGDVAQFNPTTTGAPSGRQVWLPLEQSNTPSRVTECGIDDTVHGINDTSTNLRPVNKTTDGFGNSTDGAADHITAMAAFQTSAYFFTANFIAWNSIPSAGSDTQITRMEALKGALRSMILSVNGVRVGLMRMANNGQASSGGMVVHDMTSIESGRDDILYTLYDRLECSPSQPENCRQIFLPGGTKAIGETLFEAINYFAGCIDTDGDGTADRCPPRTLPQGLTATGSVVWGDQSKIDPNIPFESVPPSIANFADAPGQWMYRSPASECGKNFIVLLTDGLTEQDASNDTAIEKLPNFEKLPGTDKQGAGTRCDAEPVKSGATPSECVDDLPGYMWENDVNSVLPGVQNVKTFTVGFDLGTSTLGEAARQVLRDAARRGGGEYFDATDEASLAIALTEIARQILLDNGSFTAPSIAVNAFNRTQNLNDLYMSVFKPSLSYRWLGNVKKYRLTAEGQIVDANGDPAVDPATGFFAPGTQSLWSDVVDGPDATLGGAAGELKVPASRQIYTNVAVSAGAPAVFDSGTLSTALSTLKATDTATVAFSNKILFDIEAPDVVPTSYPSMVDLIDWAYGLDVQDQVGEAGVTTDPRLDMGDPLHARPATVIYGGPPSAPDTTIFAATNDGMLHAINASTGAELWAFAPVQLLPRMLDLYQDDGAPSPRVYGLDGSVKAHRIDVNQNGIIEPLDGDQVLIFFGMHRGGKHYYALDVTNRSSPKLLWRIGAEDTDPALGTITPTSSSYLPGIGQSWSVPTITRMNIDRTWGSSNPQKLVAVFGGGYDIAHDTKTSYSDDTMGNRVFIVDAITGDLIWRAGPASDSGANLQLDNMLSAITADVRSFDLTGDGFDDRMYASDLGGRIWRFDIVNGAEPDDLVKGGLFASLGVADSGGSPDTANRKFFYAPDPSLIRVEGRSWINIAIGSGNRERPVSEGRESGIPIVGNRFFSLRDYALFTSIDSDNYLDDCSTVTTEPCHQIITASDSRLTNVTTDLNPTLAANTAGWYMNLTESGEKALAESRTFQNAVYFTTYVPRERNITVECGLAVGVSKLYVVSAINANPVFNYDVESEGATSLDDRFKELAQGAIAPEVVFVFPAPENQLPNVTPPAVPPVCLVGLESCGGGVSNPPVRTYWRQRGSN